MALPLEVFCLQYAPVPRIAHCESEAQGSPIRTFAGAHCLLMHVVPGEHEVQKVAPQLPRNSPGLQMSVLQQPSHVEGLQGMKRQKPLEQVPLLGHCLHVCA